MIGEEVAQHPSKMRHLHILSFCSTHTLAAGLTKDEIATLPVERYQYFMQNQSSVLLAIPFNIHCPSMFNIINRESCLFVG